MSTGNTDRVDYTPAFSRSVGGQLLARFRLDRDGDPECDVDDDGLRHYTIELFLTSPRADKIDEVKYVMDDPTYYDPVGYSDDSDNDFREVIQSYGEVPVVVKVKIGDRVYEQRAWLSNMLENGHAGNLTPAIAEAIRHIKAN